MIIYPITVAERESLLQLNTQTATFVPCWYGEYGIAIEQDTLDTPAFAAHRALFETFPAREPVEYENSEVSPEH